MFSQAMKTAMFTLLTGSFAAATPFSIGNPSRAKWRLVGGDNIPITYLKGTGWPEFRTRVVGPKGEVKSQGCAKDLDAVFPPGSSLLIEIMDGATGEELQGDYLFTFRLLDDQERSPGTGAQVLISHTTIPGGAGGLLYLSPLGQLVFQDAVAMSHGERSMTLKADSWEPVLRERAQSQSFLKRIFGIW